jgi:D-alanyl-D-alanine carboxypeptidase
MPLFTRLLFVLVGGAVIPGPATALQVTSLQSILDSATASLDIPGAAAAVIFADGTEWEGARGIAGPGIPVGTTTAFELGSIAKVYTATVVMNLVAEGRLDLNHRLERWLPDIPGSGSITLVQLLNHTHGLHDPLQEPDFIPAVLADPGKVWTFDDVIARMRTPHFDPGAGWRYSNTGFHILGAIIEAVTDSSFADVLRASVLEPMELADTWYGPDDPDDTSLAAAYIDPSGSGVPQPVSLVMPWTAFRTSAGPAGAVVSTASNAASFLHQLATGSVLDDAEWSRMTTWVDRPDGHKYGAGLLRIEHDDRTLLGHKGNSAGYSAAAFHDQARGITAVVLTNAHAVDVTPIVTALLQAAAGIEHSRD